VADREHLGRHWTWLLVAQKELRPKPLHEISSIWVFACRETGQELLILTLRSALDRLPGYSKARSLWEESHYLLAGEGRVDVLAVEINDFVTMLFFHH